MVYVTADTHFGDENILLIKGNHDVLSNEEYRKMGFAKVYDHPVILDGFWMMSHEPLYVTRNAPYANVFGHVHGSPQYADVSCRHFIACVERTGYKPLPLEEVKRMVQTEE